ncbi:helix-turn-helix transcriptional regulator [Sinomonas sp. JGH33]|uniref:Helix-turn-helix transcriptional regulator n=1 Tax=Sinomonas terricola TaxID=3110330 RepID=A0ABU5T150_9MICC|nr:helix-turn-helix transcriptional regulator [Sinomonas sp. JGH33]MEA5453252.1 helix-turn-helix transcriptional regulator [Sinomonas sp. JGH33]
MPTPNEDREAAIKQRIEAAMEAQGLTRKAVYGAVGISRNTFEVKMAGGSFYVRELIRVADVIGIRLDDLVRGV